MGPVRLLLGRPLLVGAATAAAFLLAACSLLPSPPSDEFDITVENGTTLDVAIAVNGDQVGVVEGGDGVVIPAAGLGPLPWRVVATTSSGRELASMTVESTMGCVPLADGGRSCSGALGMARLVCGTFTMHAAAPFPEGPPAGEPGAGDPCVP